MNKTDLKKALERASHCLDENELDEAARLCTAVLHAAPRNARAFHLRAIASQRSGRGREATEDAVKAAGLRPDLPSLQLAAGSLLCREKFYDRALELYEAALRKDHDNAQYHLGVIADCFEQPTALPSDTVSFVLRGLAAIVQRSYVRDAGASRTAASALRKLGRGDEATAALRRAADAAAAAATTVAGPGDPAVQAQAQYKLGQHLRSTGEAREAADAYARCLELDPGHVLAAFWLTATRKLAASNTTEPQQDGSSGGKVDHTQSGRNEISRQSSRLPHATKTTASTGTLETPAPPAAAPREYVVGLYNGYAETFDSHLQGSLAYRTPAVIVETLRLLFPGRRWKRCLDLGAGTGLSGQAASAVCDRLVGVDLSPAMVRRARDKHVYHRLLVGDVTETIDRLCDESRAAIAKVGAEGDTEAGSKIVGGSASGTGLLPCSSSVLDRRWEVPATEEEAGGAGGSRDSSRQGRSRIGKAGVEAPVGAAGASPEAEAEAVVARNAGTTGLIGEGAKTVPSKHTHGFDASATSSGITTPTGGTRDSSSTTGEGKGELVLSCDVFGYIGCLRACFAAVRELLKIGESCPPAAGRHATPTTPGTTTSPETEEKPAPVFAFSAEAPPVVANSAVGAGAEERGAGNAESGSRPGYELQGTGRYSHSREYLERVCHDTGFRVLVADDVVLRKNAGVPVKGFVFIAEAVVPSAPAS